MGWMQKLNEVYDTMIEVVPEAGSNEAVLIPVGFIQKQVKYLVTLRPDGTFSDAREMTEDEMTCIVPSTPQAEARTGDNGTPFPLAEQLKYLACDGADNPRLVKYLHQLKDWCDQPDAPDCLRTLYCYLEKKTLLQDLCSVSGLKVKYHKDEAKKDAGGADAKVFVCFAVQSLYDSETRLWMREDVRKSWSSYIARAPEDDTALCYATGEQRKPLDNHPKVQGNAKLISAKDAGYPFQYKGRFAEDKSAATVSAYASIRAHNALKWLLGKQGFHLYGLNIVAWNVRSGSLPVPLKEDDSWVQEPNPPDTFEEYALALKEATAGRGEKLKYFQKLIGSCEDTSEDIASTVILGMEAATDGRMSINYYQEMEGNVYAQNLENWYKTCCWEYFHKDGSRMISTPTPLMIARAVMGADSVQRAIRDVQCKKSDAKQMKDLFKRLLCCIVDGAPLPKNASISAIHRAEFPLSFKTSSGSWQRRAWEDCVRTTCALIRRVRFDDGTPLEELPQNRLNVTCRNRDYLYGRLLAVADVLEQRTNENNGLPTNAIRIMQFFVQRPAEAWKQLHLKLIPYLKKLGESEKSAEYYQRLIGQIEQLFAAEDVDRVEKISLEEDFLLGLYAQTRELYTKAEERMPSAEPVLEYRPSCNRSELFGCLLAVADCAEWTAESEEKEDKTISRHDGKTLALRYMTKFASRPAETWEQIHGHLIPYLEKLGIKNSQIYLSQLHHLECCFQIKDRLSNIPLDRMFLHGYYCMRQCIKTKKAKLVVPEYPQKQTVMSRERAYAALLAIENRIERTVLDAEKSEDENRSSNAIRFMNRFPEKPASMWGYLEERMLPYERKLHHIYPGSAKKRRDQLNQLKEQIEENHWNTDEPLQAGWLYFYYIHYYCREGE